MRCISFPEQVKNELNDHNLCPFFTFGINVNNKRVKFVLAFCFLLGVNKDIPIGRFRVVVWGLADEYPIGTSAHHASLRLFNFDLDEHGSQAQNCHPKPAYGYILVDTEQEAKGKYEF